MLAENRLALIRTWSMAGAREDLGMHFEWPLDMRAAGIERGGEVHAETDPPSAAPVLMKSAGEDDWQPLVAERNAA